MKSQLSDEIKLKISVTPEQIPYYLGGNDKGVVTDQNVMAKKKKTLCCSTHRPPKKTSKSGSWKVWIPVVVYWDGKSQKIVDGRYREKAKVAIDDTEHMIRTADSKTSYKNLLSTPVLIQKSSKRDPLQNKHNLRGPG